MGKQRLVVLTGAGMSAESGLATFRGADGLWEGHDIYEVASPQGWERDMDLVLEFYNQRRKQLLESVPNPGHHTLADLESDYAVDIVTQNVDDLHERAGSSNILHLHGELRKVRSTRDPSLVRELEGWELKRGDLCELGSQLRPHIVWFGEAVPLIETAAEKVQAADILVIVGTSLNVYPAAGLVGLAPPHAKRFLVDPNPPDIPGTFLVDIIAAGASEGLGILAERLKGT